MSERFSRPDIVIDPGQDQEVREPPMFKVLLYNDDYTTMEFVVLVLMDVFGKSETESMHIMLSVHKKGVGVCGVFTSEVAETKVAKVHDLARENGYPLKSGMEEV
jgi:ATP-dependent Clp protease adaptor protein ClpS